MTELFTNLVQAVSGICLLMVAWLVFRVGSRG